MKASSFNTDGQAVLPSPFHAPRFRSPPVSLRLRSFTTPSNNFSKLRIGFRSPHAEIPAAKSVAAYQRPIAPLQLKSRSGKLLLQVMQTRPHLLPSAIDEQLEMLRLDPAAADDGDDLEEIFYCTIIQKFSDKNISMMTMTGLDSWSECQEQKLRAVHSAAAMDMIDGHLSFVEKRFAPHLDKIRLGKLYSASVKYGYYLKRVDERFQMDRSTDTLPRCGVEPTILYDEGDGTAPYGLRSYVRCLDEEMLQRFATIRSKEAVSLIEKHEAAANGAVRIASSYGLTMLVLEAVTFGSFLWEAECYIESKCQLLAC